MKLKPANCKGFTILELLIVVAMIGAIMTLVTIRVIGPEKAARDTRRINDIKQYANALEVYAAKSGGSYPVATNTVSAISLCGAGNPLGEIPCIDDPHAGSVPDYGYNYQSDAAGTDYVLWGKLEKVVGFYVSCSDGNTGTYERSRINVRNGNCPI